MGSASNYLQRKAEHKKREEKHRRTTSFKRLNPPGPLAHQQLLRAYAADYGDPIRNEWRWGWGTPAVMRLPAAPRSEHLACAKPQRLLGAYLFPTPYTRILYSKTLASGSNISQHYNSKSAKSEAIPTGPICAYYRFSCVVVPPHAHNKAAATCQIDP
jgi:hypothetical protein